MIYGNTQSLFYELFYELILNPKLEYKLLSAISHPSYLNYMQIKNYSGTYNKYTETTIEGGIIYLRRLMSDVLKVMPEGNQYIDTLSSNIKSWYNTWDLGLYKNVNV